MTHIKSNEVSEISDKNTDCGLTNPGSCDCVDECEKYGVDLPDSDNTDETVEIIDNSDILSVDEVLFRD
jgi:hypothetical protein